MGDAASFLAECRARKLTLVTAESCTGGLIAALLTEIPGASDVLTHGFITYADEAKIRMLGVDAALIAQYGAVSEQVAVAMAQGARKTAGADIAIAVTGIAGPSGGSAAKPVGLVHFACYGPGERRVALERRFGDPGRGAIRLAAVAQALALLTAAARDAP